MNHNPLVTEIRKKRAEILDSYQGNYHTMMNAMKQSQWESGREVVNLAGKNRHSTSSEKPARRKTAKLPGK
jgi:6-phosphofructokinase